MTKSLPWILAALFLAPPAFAQTDQADLVPPLGAADLNRNLARLASNPRDVDAMIGAGEAALALDDPHGAAGFFARADAIASGNGRIKAGLALCALAIIESPGTTSANGFILPRGVVVTRRVLLEMFATASMPTPESLYTSV